MCLDVAMLLVNCSVL